jgi:tripartite-type tricarboxylate transporter receptor subunit TctC
MLRAPRDGHTLLAVGSSHWLLPYLRDKAPFDPVKDYAPITLAVSSPNLIVIPSSVAAANVKELIALAKAKPGALNYASGSTGSSNHLAAELFKSMAGVNVVRIAYKGSSPALTDLLGGRVQMMFANAASVMPHVKADKLKALAVTSAQPSELVPGLPTVAASGLPGYEAVTIIGIFALADTPSAVIGRLNQEMVRVLQRSDIKEKFFGAGVETIGSTPMQLEVAMKAEMLMLGKLIKEAGIRDE